MKKIIIFLADLFGVEMVKVVEKPVQVEKIVYVYDGDVVNGDLVVKGNLTVHGNVDILGGLSAGGYITSTDGSAKRVVIRNKQV